MQKHAIARNEKDPAQPAPSLRLATTEDVGVVGPARQLQRDLAKALAAERGWTVRRTVVIGAVFNAAVLGSLVLAAGGAIPHLTR
ncbi:MAG: hypothetical protein J7521_17500 [Caulobacter sp.]|nr:hypothetical protein [Caulobacter sp.]